MDLDKIKDNIEDILSDSNNIDNIEVEWSPYSDYVLEVKCTICPVHALRCIEVPIPLYIRRKVKCLHSLDNKRAHISFSKWFSYYYFDYEKAKYTFK